MKCCAQCGGTSVDRLVRVDINDDTVTQDLGTLECSECGECTVIDVSEYARRHGSTPAVEADDFGDELVNECRAILLGARL